MEGTSGFDRVVLPGEVKKKPSSSKKNSKKTSKKSPAKKKQGECCKNICLHNDRFLAGWLTPDD